MIYKENKKTTKKQKRITKKEQTKSKQRANKRIWIRQTTYRTKNQIKLTNKKAKCQ